MFQRTLNGSCLNGKFNWEKNSDDGAKVRNKQTNKQKWKKQYLNFLNLFKNMKLKT